MVITSSRVIAQDRQDRMLLTMAVDTARAKSKSRDVRLKIAKQVGHRGVRYQKFKGRRGAAMDEELQEIIRERRKKSIRFMEEWLEAQLQANAKEGTSRFELNDCPDEVSTPFTVKDTDESIRSPESIPEVANGEIEAEDLGTSGHPLITSLSGVEPWPEIEKVKEKCSM